MPAAHAREHTQLCSATMADPRLSDLKDLNGEFPFKVPASIDEWDERRAALTRQLMVANGLWPMPEDRPPVSATVHGRVEREGYTVDRVFLETSPGLFVTGSLYKPKKPASTPMPAIMCPHMHTPADPGSGGGRFHDCVQEIDKYLAEGWEDYAVGGRHPLQARCVHLARNMGCAAFLYDMQGGRSEENWKSGPNACYGDGGSFNYDIIHGFAKQRPHMSAPDHWGLYSAQAELRMVSVLGIHTLNSLRIVDWLESLPDIDNSRIGATHTHARAQMHTRTHARTHAPPHPPTPPPHTQPQAFVAVQCPVPTANSQQLAF